MADRIQTLMGQMRQINDNIAHDLRSPLTRIRGIAETGVMAGRLNVQGEELAGGVIEECDRLIQMINTMLDISETEAGMQALSLEPVDIGGTLTSLLELFSDMAEEKQVALVAQLPHVAPILADARRLQRMFANLLDNAVKYTPPGGRIRVELIPGDTQVQIRVSDTGPGIPAADLPHVFERFYRADHSRHQPGNGLGLSLALAIARAHGGDITVGPAQAVESTDTQGTCITVTLPRQP